MNPDPSSSLSLRTWPLLLCCLLASSCATKPPPESEWNCLGIWHRVGDNPPTYVPNGYSPRRAQTNGNGAWFQDKRDGKRVFVPDETVGPWDPEILKGEAKKITGFVYREPVTKESVAEGILETAILLAAAMCGAL